MTIWVISDTHFGHENMVTTFKLADGSPARKFSSVEEMDETMIERWNEVVRPSDHVYHLGDVSMKRNVVDAVMPRLNGHKRLVHGNHDIFQTKLYAKYFEKIMGVRVLDEMIFTHIPIAPWSLRPKFKANVHGHVHESQGRVMRYHMTDNVPSDHSRPREVTYVNMSVEVNDYRPVTLEEIKSWV